MKSDKFLKECLFGVTFSVDNEQLKQSKMDLIRYKKTTSAQDMGELIGNKKTWDMRPINPKTMVGELQVYVFTKQELNQFVENVLWNNGVRS